MNEASKLSLDTALTALRYGVIAYCTVRGVDSTSTEAIANFSIALATVAWGFHASGYWKRFKELFKNV